MSTYSRWISQREREREVSDAVRELSLQRESRALRLGPGPQAEKGKQPASLILGFMV